MWELCLHLDYDHLYISLIPNKAQTNIFLVKKTYCCVGQDFWKKASIFPV